MLLVLRFLSIGDRQVMCDCVHIATLNAIYKFVLFSLSSALHHKHMNERRSLGGGDALFKGERGIVELLLIWL